MILVRKFLSFGLVGLIGTAVHYFVLVVLVEIAKTEPVMAATWGFAAGAVVNYLLNKRYTFRSKKNHLDAAPKFFTVAIITGILNTLIVYAGVTIIGLNYMIVQISATIVVFVLNFIFNNVWTFQQRNPT